MIGTTVMKHSNPMLELGFTQLKQELHHEGDLTHINAASQLSSKLGKDVSSRMLHAYNDLTRALICTTKPKRAREAAELSVPEQCLTLDTTKQPRGAARPDSHLPGAAAYGPAQTLIETASQVKPDLRKLYLKACRQRR